MQRPYFADIFFHLFPGSAWEQLKVAQLVTPAKAGVQEG